MSETDETALRLAVLDAEDLAVVSAHLQDAEASLQEMTYLPKQTRFALAVARFDWPLASKGRFARRETGVSFGRVLRVARSGFAAIGPTQTLRLLAIAFVPADPPAGIVLLTFLGGAQIKLEVECLEAEMRDIGPPWSVEGRPVGTPGDAPSRRTAAPGPTRR